MEKRTYFNNKIKVSWDLITGYHGEYETKRQDTREIHS